MRRVAAFVLAFSFVSSSAGAQVMAGRTSMTLPDTSQLDVAGRAIIRIERGRSASIAALDTTALRSVYAEDFRGIAANGARIDRGILFTVFSRDDPSSTFAIDELTVRTLDARGNSALLTGRLRTFRDGAQVAQSRYSHIYAKRAGRWLIVGAQATLVPAS